MIYLILILSAFLRFAGIGTRPFDGDEGVILKVVYNSWGDLITQATKDVHPPLFHILLKPFLDWFGIYQWSGRLLPALLGIVLIYLVYQLSRKLFNKSNLLAVTSAFFIAISSYLIYPSQEIRMYMLFAVLVTISYYFFWILVSGRKVKETIWSKYSLGYILSSTLMIYTQYIGFVILFSQLCYIIFACCKSKDFFKKIIEWFVYWLSVIILFLPQIKTLLLQFSARVSEQSQSISVGANIKGLAGAFYRFGSGRLFLDLTPVAIKNLLSDNPWLFIGFLITLIIPLILFIKGLIICYKKFRIQFWFIVIPIIIAVILTIFSSEIGSRANRYLIYLFPFYIILLSLASLDYWKNKWLRILPIIFVLINLTGLYHHYFVENKAPGVNTISEFIYDNYKDGDVVLIRGGFGGGEEFVFNYYWSEPRLDIPVVDMLGNYQAGNLAELKAVNPQDKAIELLQNYQRVWFYDLTYSNYQIIGQKHNLGKDKENKDLIIWEITK